MDERHSTTVPSHKEWILALGRGASANDASVELMFAARMASDWRHISDWVADGSMTHLRIYVMVILLIRNTIKMVVVSETKAGMGKWAHTASEWYADEADKGIQTSEDACFYGISAKMDKEFKSEARKDLIIQYSVKRQQNLDRGGAYIKLLPGGSKFYAAKFRGEDLYGAMFGPDTVSYTHLTLPTILLV